MFGRNVVRCVDFSARIEDECSYVVVFADSFDVSDIERRRRYLLFTLMLRMTTRLTTLTTDLNKFSTRKGLDGEIFVLYTVHIPIQFYSSTSLLKISLLPHQCIGVGRKPSHPRLSLYFSTLCSYMNVYVGLSTFFFLSVFIEILDNIESLPMARVFYFSTRIVHPSISL